MSSILFSWRPFVFFLFFSLYLLDSELGFCLLISPWKSNVPCFLTLFSGNIFSNILVAFSLYTPSFSLVCAAWGDVLLCISFAAVSTCHYPVLPFNDSSLIFVFFNYIYVFLIYCNQIMVDHIMMSFKVWSIY